MTLSTSLVAVCCSSNSRRSSVRWRSSLSSRAFSIAMTACAPKFVTNSICLSVKGRTVETHQRNYANRRSFSQKWDTRAVR